MVYRIEVNHKIIRQYRCTVITLFSLADGMEQLNLLSQHNETFGILTGFETVRNMSVLLGESATHSHLSKPPVKPNLSQHNGIFGILTGFETVGKRSCGTEGI